MLDRVSELFNMDAILELLTAGVIEGSRRVDLLARARLVPGFATYAPGRPLKILLVGYNGARNIGADVRVESMLRQLYQILGRENVQLSVMTLDAAHSRTYVPPPAELIDLSSVFFRDLLAACSTHHMAILSEGTTFSSSFANALTALFMGASGIMRMQGKPTVAYGCDAGAMDGLLTKLVRRYANDTYFFSRTEPSQTRIRDLGLKGELGTDPAWIFTPAPDEWAKRELAAHGWEGKAPLVGAAIMNPFHWPVRPDLWRFLEMSALGRHRDEHYDRWYFFASSAERRARFDAFINAVARSLDAFADRHGAQLVIFAEDRLDHEAACTLQRRLSHRAPLFTSIDYNGFQVAALLRRLSLLVTSAYHMRLLSAPAGVASGAVALDERLEYMLRESGHLDYFLKTDDPELAAKLPVMLDRLWENRTQVGGELKSSVRGHLQRLAAMGASLKQLVHRRFPELHLPPDPSDWRGYLPPLPPELDRVLAAEG